MTMASVWEQLGLALQSLCNILSLNTPVTDELTDELLVIRLVNLLGYVVSVDYRL